MNYGLVAVVFQNSIALSDGYFTAQVRSREQLKLGTVLCKWKQPQTVREIYEQAERDYYRHNPTLDGQS